MHTFHIPVMGLAFTIDSPAKVARFGINSVVSIMQDELIEKMRKHYYKTINEKYYPITAEEEDYRAKRISDYLNLLSRIISKQIETLKKEEFCTGSEIDRYFEMLHDKHPLHVIYNKMVSAKEADEKKSMQHFLRQQVRPGSIDVNIMTKTDKVRYRDGLVIADGSDAVTALRGFAESSLTGSSVIFSAGMNPRLFSYLEKCKAHFEPDSNGIFNKKVIIKVSDYRSALIQGKFLTKKGIWVSEFRIESGLNCGGHAFATNGLLMGPILEEFKSKRDELKSILFDIYKSAGNPKPAARYDLKITIQGGIGTAEENNLLLNYFNADGTGWGTPFLLVPEATTVDDESLELLSKAQHENLILSNSSPLGVRFYYLKGTTAEKERQKRIINGRAGSPCTEKYLAFNTEFTVEPLCTASYKYQKLKTKQLQSMNLPSPEFEKQVAAVYEKECLCVGLSNAAPKKMNFTFRKSLTGVTVCPGPNIINFSRVVSLKEMTDHIYGRSNLITNPRRQHMFITELNLYIDYLAEKTASLNPGLNIELTSFIDSLQEGINYYRSKAAEWFNEAGIFLSDLSNSEQMLNKTILKYNG